jgi:4'-phosphopantetheinyl transferase EntD
VSTIPQSDGIPSNLSPLFAGLFPAGVVAAESREPGDPALLLPAEAAHLGRAVAKRVQEFAAGRLCVRRALHEYGIDQFPLRVAADRQPIWPEGFIGSITHTAGLCAAVVAESRTIAAVGIDSEIVGHVTPDIWSTICVADEADWVNSLPPSERAAAVTLIFSAKEAFYKCQYPMVSEWLDFHDLVIESETAGQSGQNAGRILIRATRRIRFEEHALLPMVGRYQFHEQFVSVGVALPQTSNISRNNA